jgi:hypothetical protein
LFASFWDVVAAVVYITLAVLVGPALTFGVDHRRSPLPFLFWMLLLIAPD